MISIGRLALLGGIGYLGYRYISRSYPTVLTGTAARDYIVDYYRSEFRGYPGAEAVARAAAVNAYAESAWDSRAVGDSGHSVGLFQLYDKGLGQSVALPLVDGKPDPSDPRFSPRIQCKLTCEAVRQSSGMMAFVTSDAATVEAATFAFCVYIEKPADSTTRGSERMALVSKLGLGL